MSIRVKLMLSVFLVVLLFFLSLNYLIVPEVRSSIYQQKKKQVENLVDSMMGVVEYYYQLEEKGELSRVVAQQRALEVIKNSSFGEGGRDYFWVNDYHPRMVMHPYKPELNGQDLSESTDVNGFPLFNEMVEVVQKDGQGFVEYHWQYYDQTERIEPKISYVAGFEPWQWIIGTGLYINDVNFTVSQTRNRILIIGLIVLVISMFIFYIFSSRISRGLTRATGFAEEIAQGNLKHKVPAIRSRDELGRLINSLQIMQENLQQMIRNTINSIQEVTAASQKLASFGGEVEKITDQVGKAIATVASGAQEQAASIDITADNIGKMIGMIKEVDKEAEEMNLAATRVMETIMKGNSSVENSIKKVKNVKLDTMAIVERISELGKISNEIGGIVELISSIAAQTNLLALNAAIEAARAGEAGRGFSVVADEIRELAEESSRATERITGLISNIENGVNDVTGRINESVKVVDSSVLAIEETEGAFNDIRAVVNGLREHIGKVVNQVELIANSSEEVRRSIQEIAEVSEDFASSAEEVSASSQEQMASTQEVVLLSRHLAKIAEQLSRSIEEFKV